MAPRSIIIDTDPGQDDAVAIMLALGNTDALEVLGLVACAGNVGLAKTSSNALKLLELAGRTDIPSSPAPTLLRGETGDGRIRPRRDRPQRLVLPGADDGAPSGVRTRLDRPRPS